tara:strand:+ start:45 stop:1952 length:1908 start_codon:yes stop_codon:yes gene_type:complete
MQPWLIKLFHSLGRKSAAKRTGIAEIPTTISAEGHGAGFYTTLRNAGFKDEDLAKLIKSEKDIIRLVNKVKSMQNQRLKNIERKFFDPSGKMKPEGQDIMKKGLEGLGKKKDPFQVIEGGGTSAEDFLKLKEDTFRRLTMNTDDNVKAFSKRIIENKQDVKFERLTKDQRKGILDLIDDRLKLGNREFMNKHSDLNVVIDPEGLASGGIARVGFSKGKLAKGFFEFVEGLFIKASNDIRQGKGKWAGLDQKQRMVQHDNLTKMVTQWQKTKQLPEGAEQYFGFDAEKVFTQMNEKKDDILKNLTHDFKGKPYKGVAQTVEGTFVDERTMLKQKYPGISDDLLDKILIDDNPQRKADVLSTLDQYLKLRQVGKGEEEAYDIITKSFKKTPTKHASGGIAGPLHLYDGGRVPFLKGKIVQGLKGFDKGRREFLKKLGAFFGTGVAAGTGILKLGSKTAPKAVAPAAEVVTRGADGVPTYVWDLINVVKAKGTKEIIENFHHPKFKYDTVYTYKGVEVAEDAGGNIKIKSDKSGVATDASTGKMHEGIAQENHIQIDRGQMSVKDEGLETQKSFQEPNEYFEGTVYPDMDGKMKDVVDGLDKEVHEYFKSIADESLIKKAEGGRVSLSKGGLAHILGV